MEKIRVMLVDDQQLFLENLKTVLELTTDDIDVVGVAENGSQAIELLGEVTPDVILMDVRMPDMDGVEATRVIHRKDADIKILMLTTFDNDEYVTDAIEYGAEGYILKNIRPPELIASIRTVASGEVVLAPAIAHRILGRNTSDDAGRVDNESSGDELMRRFASLTEREIELVKLIAHAHSNREIAELVCISEQTAKNYISRVYSKLLVNKRSELMQQYYEIIKSLEDRST